MGKAGKGKDEKKKIDEDGKKKKKTPHCFVSFVKVLRTQRSDPWFAFCVLFPVLCRDAVPTFGQVLDFPMKETTEDCQKAVKQCGRPPVWSIMACSAVV